MAGRYPEGSRGDVARLFSAERTHGGKPSPGMAIQRVVTRPGPVGLVLYRLSHRIWVRGFHTLAEIVWRINLFLTGADIHPGAELEEQLAEVKRALGGDRTAPIPTNE